MIPFFLKIFFPLFLAEGSVACVTIVWRGCGGQITSLFSSQVFISTGSVIKKSY